MKTKTTRQIDAQGRISLPSYIRNAMNLGPGNIVSVEIDDEGVVHIQATDERCCICGVHLEDQNRVEVVTARDKAICNGCAKFVHDAVAKERGMK